MSKNYYLICLTAGISLILAFSAQSQTIPSTGASTKGTYSLEVKIITPEQVGAYQRGKHPSEIVLKTGETLEEFLYPKVSTPNYELAWSAISCAGDSSDGDGQMGNLEVEGVCGEPAVGTSMGGDYELSQGITRDNTEVFLDGFESGDIAAWEPQ